MQIHFHCLINLFTLDFQKNFIIIVIIIIMVIIIIIKMYLFDSNFIIKR